MPPISYARHQFPCAVIQHAVWIYLRFTLSYRDVEDLLAERGLDVSYESIRRWMLKFGPAIARAFDNVGQNQQPIGIWTRRWCGLPARGCISGAPWTARERSSTSSCSAD